MKIKKARKLIKKLMTENKAFGWRAYFTPCEFDAGVTFSFQKVIEFCEPFFLNNPYSVCRDTILHETAHALLPAGCMHGETWKAKCIEIGAIPEEYLGYEHHKKIYMPRDPTYQENMIEFMRPPSYPEDESKIIRIESEDIKCMNVNRVVVCE